MRSERNYRDSAMSAGPKTMTETISNKEVTMANGFPRKLRVGILVDGSTVSIWAYNMLERIQGSEYAEIVQVVERAEEEKAPRKDISGWMKLINRLFYFFYSRVDVKLSRVKDDPLVQHSLRPLLADCQWEKVEPIRTGKVERFSDEDLSKIAPKKVDVYLRLGFGILKGKILTAAPCGLWSYHHGDNRVFRGLPPGFWEVFSNQPVTGVILQILNEDLDGGQVIYRSFSKTNSVYVHRGLCELLWKSTAIIPRMLCRLHSLGPNEFHTYATERFGDTGFYSDKLYSYPGNAQVISLVFKSVFRIARQKYKGFMYKYQWALMFSYGPSSQSQKSMWRFKEITPPVDRFWADPFVIRREDAHHVFFEECIDAIDKGTIAHVRIDSDGAVSKPVPILEEQYHLSYPFVFEYEGDHYMVPESAANRTVRLYKCTRFPDQWSFVRTLIDDIELVDSTLIFHENRWWLFGGQRDNPKVSISEELSVFYTDNLLNGTWSAHPCNPVVSDIRCARPAGRIYSKGGKLFRPSQDCSLSYGGAITINRIEKLTTERYREVQVDRISPDWRSDLLGTHNLDRTEALTIVDAEVRRRRGAAWWGR